MEAKRQLTENPSEDIHTYRAFIDGLRAIAILSVVGSHLSVPGFSGGYVGVDIFFVISGYLIINQIVQDIGRRRFNIFEFFARRTFRILPAFLLVIVSCGALATTIFVQPETKEFAESFLRTAIMLSNHYFLAHQGYFDMAAFTKPFLHTWSLAVEEQFYLVAPLLLLGLYAATARLETETANKVWSVVALLLGIVLFAGCVAFTYPPDRPNISFYIMPLRGWEFILGGIIPGVAARLRRAPSGTGDVLALIGMLVIVLAVVSFDDNTLYPSYRAAIPALGAASIIIGGLLNNNNSVARALAIRPMVWIGLVSYAWYLWHWPLISFVRTLNFGKPNVVEEASIGFVSLALAALTYFFIELRFQRMRRKLMGRPVRAVAGGIASCISVAGIGYLWTLNIAPLMLPTITGLEALTVRDAALRERLPVLHRGILMGDSHANHFAEPFQLFAQYAGANLAVVAKNGCLPLLQIAGRRADGYPASECEPLYNAIKFAGAEFVIFTARWNFYLGLPQSDPYHRSDILVGRQTGRRQNPSEVLSSGLDATISQAQGSGVERILIVAPFPEFPWYAPYCVMRSIRLGADFCTISRKDVEARRKLTMLVLRGLVDRYKGIRLIDPIDLFCSERECRPNKGRELFFSDTNHLSAAGIERLFKEYERQFLWALTGF